MRRGGSCSSGPTWRFGSSSSGPDRSSSGSATAGFGRPASRRRFPHAHLQDLADALIARDVQRVEFDAELSRDAFHAFVDLLDRSEQGLKHCGGFARGLAARSSQGIRVNGGEEDALAAQQSLSSTPAMSTASLGSALLSVSRSLVVDADGRGREREARDRRAAARGPRNRRAGRAPALPPDRAGPLHRRLRV